MNKDCRQIWTGCFAKCKKVFQLCKPPSRKLRADTGELTKDSRCSSTLTVLSPDPRGSELYDIQTTANPKARIPPSYLLPRSVARLKAENVILTGIKPRASTLSLPAVMREKMTTSDSNSQIPSSLDGFGPRSRCSSVPVNLQKELETETASEQGNVTTYFLSPLARDVDVTKSTNSDDSDANSETDNFIQKNNEETFSPS